MNEKTFNKLLWEFHRELEWLNYFTDETITNYISCIQQYRRFPRKDSNLMHDATVNRRITKYATVAGIRSHITAHCLRHSFATEMYYADVPLEALKTMMGHENLRETAVYIHISERDMSTSCVMLWKGYRLLSISISLSIAGRFV